MKHLRKYEEFDWHSIISNPTFRIVSGFLITNLLIKYGGKYLLHKKRMDYYKKSMENDLYTKGRWQVDEKGDEITISKKMHSGDLKPRYSLNTKTREFQFISDVYPIKVKFSSTDMNNMVNDLKWIKEVSESIEDCFHDLRDEGFEVELAATDFIKKGLVVSMHKVTHNEEPEFDIDPYDEDEDDLIQLYYRADEGKFNLRNYIEQISEFISKVEGLYGVKIDDSYTKNSNDHDIHGSHGKYILKSSDLRNNKLMKNNISTLIIPFKR